MQFRYELSNIFSFASWQLFVAIAALPSLVCGLCLTYFPESPKFLLEIGEADEALDILKAIFQSNTGRDVSEYPVSQKLEHF